MATYEFISPEGKKYRVTGDGTAEEAFEELERKLAGPSSARGESLSRLRALENAMGPAMDATLAEQQEVERKKKAAADYRAGLPSDSTNPIDLAASAVDWASSKLKPGLTPAADIKTGVAHAADRAIAGVKGLVTDLSPEERQRLEAGQTATEEAGALGTAGQIAADVGMAALPIGAVNRAAQLVNVGRYALPAVDVAANAAYSGATAPEDRGEAAAWGGGGAAVGRAANRILGGLVRPTAAAEEALRRGAQLTPGQAGEGVMGSLARDLEGSLTAVPVGGRLTEYAHKKGVESIKDMMFDTAKVRDDLVERIKNLELAGKASKEASMANLIRAGVIGLAGHTAIGAGVIPLYVAAQFGHLPQVRKLMLGQYTWQQFIKKYPELSAQMGRAAAQQEEQQP